MKHQLYAGSQLTDWLQLLVDCTGSRKITALLLLRLTKNWIFYLHFVFVDYLLFQPHCHDYRFISCRVIERCLIGQPCIFQWQMLSQLNILSVVNADRSQHTTCPQMRQQTNEVGFNPLLHLITICRCLFQLQLDVAHSISGIWLLHHALLLCPEVFNS